MPTAGRFSVSALRTATSFIRRTTSTASLLGREKQTLRRSPAGRSGYASSCGTRSCTRFNSAIDLPDDELKIQLIDFAEVFGAVDSVLGLPTRASGFAR